MGPLSCKTSASLPRHHSQSMTTSVVYFSTILYASLFIAIWKRYYRHRTLYSRIAVCFHDIISVYNIRSQQGDALPGGRGGRRTPGVGCGCAPRAARICHGLKHAGICTCGSECAGAALSSRRGTLSDSDAGRRPQTDRDGSTRRSRWPGHGLRSAAAKRRRVAVDCGAPRRCSARWASHSGMARALAGPGPGPHTVTAARAGQPAAGRETDRQRQRARGTVAVPEALATGPPSRDAMTARSGSSFSVSVYCALIRYGGEGWLRSTAGWQAGG